MFDFILTCNIVIIDFDLAKIYDQYVIIDYGKRNEKIFHCGSSSKNLGNRVTTISVINDWYKEMINNLLGNQELIII